VGSNEDDSMNLTAEEKSQRSRLNDWYQLGQSPLMLSIERSVCGCDYGASSWTTQAEAQEIASLLQLEHQTMLLDLGSGSGWHDHRLRCCPGRSAR